MLTSDGYKYLRAEVAERLRGMEVNVRRPMDGSLQGLHRSPVFGSSVEFAEYREYLPGDPISRIDWPVYARSDRYVIRQYHEDISIRCYILLDVSESMTYRDKGVGGLSKLEYACHLAAGMAYLMVHQGDTVAMVTFDNRIRDFYEPAGTLMGLKPMLTGLEAIEARREGSIEAALHGAADLITGRAMVVLISDLLEEPGRIMQGIAHLYHDGKDITVFHVLDPGELRLPQVDELGSTTLVDVHGMEQEGRLTVDLAQIRESYLEQVHGYLNEIRAACSNTHTEYVLAETDREVYEALLTRSRMV